VLHCGFACLGLAGVAPRGIESVGAAVAPGDDEPHGSKDDQPRRCEYRDLHDGTPDLSWHVFVSSPWSCLKSAALTVGVKPARTLATYLSARPS
jgi:hypothetical protein